MEASHQEGRRDSALRNEIRHQPAQQQDECSELSESDHFTSGQESIWASYLQDHTKAPPALEQQFAPAVSAFDCCDPNCSFWQRVAFLTSDQDREHQTSSWHQQISCSCAACAPSGGNMCVPAASQVGRRASRLLQLSSTQGANSAAAYAATMSVGSQQQPQQQPATRIAFARRNSSAVISHQQPNRASSPQPTRSLIASRDDAIGTDRKCDTENDTCTSDGAVKLRAPTSVSNVQSNCAERATRDNCLELAGAAPQDGPSETTCRAENGSLSKCIEPSSQAQLVNKHRRKSRRRDDHRAGARRRSSSAELNREARSEEAGEMSQSKHDREHRRRRRRRKREQLGAESTAVVHSSAGVAISVTDTSGDTLNNAPDDEPDEPDDELEGHSVSDLFADARRSSEFPGSCSSRDSSFLQAHLTGELGGATDSFSSDAEDGESSSYSSSSSKSTMLMNTQAQQQQSRVTTRSDSPMAAPSPEIVDTGTGRPASAEPGLRLATSSQQAPEETPARRVRSARPRLLIGPAQMGTGESLTSPEPLTGFRWRVSSGSSVRSADQAVSSAPVGRPVNKSDARQSGQPARHHSMNERPTQLNSFLSSSAQHFASKFSPMRQFAQQPLAILGSPSHSQQNLSNGSISSQQHQAASLLAAPNQQTRRLGSHSPSRFNFGG